MAKPLDLEEMKKMKVGRRFIKIKPPEGDTYYAYRFQCLGEPYEIFNKRFNRTETHLAVKLEGVKNDEDVVVGQEYTLNLQHASLLKQVTQLKPLTGKIIDVMNRGKIHGKRGIFVEYVVILQEGELSLERLLSRIFVE